MNMKHFEIGRYGATKYEVIDNNARPCARSIAVLKFDSADQANAFEDYLNGLWVKARHSKRAERAALVSTTGGPGCSG